MTPASDSPAVLIVSDVYPPDCGGSGWSAHALARTLKAAGHRVEVVELTRVPQRAATRRFEGIEIGHIDLTAARGGLRNRLGAADFSFDPVWRQVSARLDADPELRVVHAQHLHSGPGAIAAARERGRAAIITLRDHWPTCLHGTAWQGGAACPGCSAGRLYSCMREYYRTPVLASAALVPWARRRLRTRRAGIGAAHRVLTVSDSLRSQLQRRGAEFPMTVVHNIADPTELAARAARGEAIAPAVPYLLAAGKLTATKGFDELVGRLSAIDSMPLVLAGAGPEEDALRRLAAERGLDLRLTGWVAGESLLRLARDAVAVVLPSRWQEPLSRVMLESMALGTPVIAWPMASAREVITDGVDGWIADGTEALAKAISAAADPARRETIGEAAAATARRLFSPSSVYPQLRRVYEEAIAEARGDD